MAKKLRDEILEPLNDAEKAVHLGRILDARKAHRETVEAARSAAGVMRNLIKIAGKRGLKPAAINMALAEMELDAAERRAHFKAVGEYLRILGAPLGTQFSLFDDAPVQTEQERANTETPADSVDPTARLATAHAQGFEAGWGGNDKGRNPYAENDPARPEWDRGWDDGQAKAIMEMGAKSRKRAA